MSDRLGVCRLIVDVAVMRNGVILSNDFYRDLLRDSGDAVCKTIRERYRLHSADPTERERDQ